MNWYLLGSVQTGCIARYGPTPESLVWCANLFIGDNFFNKLTSNFYMFDSFVKNGITRNKDGHITNSQDLDKKYQTHVRDLCAVTFLMLYKSLSYIQPHN